MVFAFDTTTGQTIQALAKEGVPGVIIALIIAIIVLSCFYTYLTYKREITREKEYLDAEIERNRTLATLTASINEFAKVVSEEFNRINASLDGLLNGVDTIGDKVEALEESVKAHEEIISAIPTAEPKKAKPRSKSK